MLRVLVVCTGNICRSPISEGVIRALADADGLGASLEVDSAATMDWNVGKPPDAGAQGAALRRNIDLGAQRARQVTRDDFERFDVVIAVDRGNRDRLLRICPPPLRHRVHLLLDFAPEEGTLDVPDPYGAGPEEFDRVFALIEAGVRGFLRSLPGPE